MADLLFTRTWWQYDSKKTSIGDFVYSWFNVAEGGVWLILGVLVAVRFLIYRQSYLEVLYSAAFLFFGFTDLVESSALSSWLIWIKSANLATLLILRSIVIRRYYPTAKLY